MADRDEQPDVRDQSPPRPSGSGLFGAESSAIIISGIALIILGFALISFAWGRVAALTDVHEQMPWAIGGGGVGLGVLMTGLAAVSVQARRRSAALDERQLALVVALVRDVADAFLPSATAAEPAETNGRSSTTARRQLRANRPAAR